MYILVCTFGKYAYFVLRKCQSYAKVQSCGKLQVLVAGHFTSSLLATVKTAEFMQNARWPKQTNCPKAKAKPKTNVGRSRNCIREARDTHRLQDAACYVSHFEYL